jgi:hypothetical protein
MMKGLMKIIFLCLVAFVFSLPVYSQDDGNLNLYDDIFTEKSEEVGIGGPSPLLNANSGEISVNKADTAKKGVVKGKDTNKKEVKRKKSRRVRRSRRRSKRNSRRRNSRERNSRRRIKHTKVKNTDSGDSGSKPLEFIKKYRLQLGGVVVALIESFFSGKKERRAERQTMVRR